VFSEEGSNKEMIWSQLTPHKRSNNISDFSALPLNDENLPNTPLFAMRRWMRETGWCRRKNEFWRAEEHG
jgi:hypothetical protein